MKALKAQMKRNWQRMKRNWQRNRAGGWAHHSYHKRFPLHL
jgi:hypothetical protein